MAKGSNPPPAHLTRLERQQLRDQIALRVLPFCCMRASQGCGDGMDYIANRAVVYAYVIADAMLSQRGIEE